MPKVYLMGICGTAMGSLAVALKRLGFVVSGSDRACWPPMSDYLKQNEVPVHLGFDPDHLRLFSPDRVIIGNVISANNPQWVVVQNEGYPYVSMAQFIGDQFLAHRHAVGIVGTHGKTTTTALNAFLWQRLGRPVGYLVAGVALDLPHLLDFGQDPVFFIEGDEYDTAFFEKTPKFWHYHLRDIIWTSLEYDHADIYPTWESLVAAFRGLLDRLPAQATCVIYGPNPTIRDLCHGRSLRVITYGSEGWEDYVLEEAKPQGDFWEIRWYHKATGMSFSGLTRLWGQHMALNVLAAIVYALEVGRFSVEEVLKVLPEFHGVERRHQFRGLTPQGAQVFDDFAHHPTAVRLTLEAFRAQFPHHRLWVLFEPRSNTSRRSVFQREYVQAFKPAHVVLVREPIEDGRIPENQRFDAHRLVQDLKAMGLESQVFPDGHAMIPYLNSKVGPHDIIVIMSNGDFDGIVGHLIKSPGLNSECPPSGVFPVT